MFYILGQDLTHEKLIPLTTVDMAAAAMIKVASLVCISKTNVSSKWG